MEPEGRAVARRDCVVLDHDGLQRLIGTLVDEGYQLLVPTIVDGVLRVQTAASLDDIACGWRSEEAPGAVGLKPDPTAWPIAHGLPAQGWKGALYPPHERLFLAQLDSQGFVFDQGTAADAPLALFGMRACDVAAVGVLERVLSGRPPADPRFSRRRQNAFIIAVTCTNPGASCFCGSMGTGPDVGSGADLVLTALAAGECGRCLASAGTERGASVLDRVHAPRATTAQRDAAEAAIERARSQLARQMVPGIEKILVRQANHPHWRRIAERCLACGNCTAVCPTCFCATVEDRTDLQRQHAERWRRWDSCFTLAFSYLHGGGVRASGASRYRQWMTHKLSFWWDQFECSGCVGCGRCISWCPVGIDITAEADAFAAFDGGRTP